MGVKHTVREAGVPRERNEVAKQPSSGWREKALRKSSVPVPQTDAGGREENSETDGRTLVKELGKMTP